MTGQKATATATTTVGLASSGLKTYSVASTLLNEAPTRKPRWMSRSAWYARVRCVAMPM